MTRRREECIARLTLVEVYRQVPGLGQGKHANEIGIVVLELLAHRRQLVLGEEPVAPLRRLPVVGGHCIAPWERRWNTRGDAVCAGPVGRELRSRREVSMYVGDVTARAESGGVGRVVGPWAGPIRGGCSGVYFVQP